MLGRFACTTDDNVAVIMQVQFPRQYNPGPHVALMFGYKGRKKGVIVFVMS